MLKKILITLTLIVIANNALANNVSTTDIKQTVRAVPPKSKFSLEFLISSQQTKNIVDNSHDGSYSNFDTSLLYSLDQNNEVRSYLSTRYIETQQEIEGFGNELELFFWEVMYRRKNILTQADHGIYMQAELKGLQYIDPDITNMFGYDQTLIPQLIFNKRWGRALSAELKVRRHFNRTHSDDAYTPNFEDRIYLSASTFLSRRMMFYTQFKYQHKIRKADGLDWRFADLISFDPITHRPDFSQVPEAKKHQEILSIHSSIMHFLSRKALVEFYAETRLSDTYNKQTIEEIAKNQFVLGTAFYITAF